MPVAHNLIRDIDMKKEKIARNPAYFLVRSKKVQHALNSSMKIYSWMIEHPDVRRALVVKEGFDRRRLIAQAKKGVLNLQSAWKYLRTVNNPLNEEVIREVASLVEPALNKDGNYRNSRASLVLNSVPPNHIRVSELMEQRVSELNAGDLHPLEKAAMAHLYIAGIQPFRNGNKRIARLIQDKILYNAELPPAVIPVGEREVYIDLLDQALFGLQTGSLFKQRPFFDYVGGKVNTALDEILGDLKIRA